MKFVAVTSCPTGIAHTYMAAESLEQGAARSGHEIHVETQGASGSEPLDPAVIAAADGVIFAADVEVRGRERFAGKPVVQFSVKAPISDAEGVFIAAVAAVESHSTIADYTADEVEAVQAMAGPASKVAGGGGVGTRVRQWLMTGVSYMIPFVAAGGIMIALSFMIGGYSINTVTAADLVANFSLTSKHDWAGLLFVGGSTAFGFLVAVLAGFIAYAIADRPGIAPGFVGGALCVAVGAGFLGGLVIGFAAGFVALGISRLNVPASIRSVMPVVVTPLVSTLLISFLTVVVLGKPLAALMDALTNGLNALSGAGIIVLGVILGLMQASDMGGPINKVAYTFATTGLVAVGTSAAADAPQLKIMAAVMAAGMTPPLGLALATVLRKKLFSEAERHNGKAAWVLGASFITEGAIPFAAVDPLRVIPSCMLGSGVAGGLVMAFGSTLRAPHGGIWVIPLIGNPFLYLLAIAAGAVTTCVSVIVLKSWNRTPKAAVASASSEPAPAAA